MATAKVTGNLTDFSDTKMNEYQPRIVFTPSGPAVDGQKVLVTRPVTTTPNAAGGFEVNLLPNGDFSPETSYEVSVEWLDSAGACVFIDRMPWSLIVPDGGGDIGELMKVPSNPSRTWVGETAPPNPTPGTWWLIPSSGDLYEWSK